MYAVIAPASTIWRSKRTRPKVYSFAVYWTDPHARPASRWRQHGDQPPLLSLRWASDLRYGHRQCIAHPSAAALVDLILGTLQYCPSNSGRRTVTPTCRRICRSVAVRSGKRRFRALYHHVPVISQLIYGVLAVILSCLSGYTGHGVCSRFSGQK